MFNNYLKTAWRNLLKSKGYSFINIMGLTMGLTCCFLILLFIKHELSYDKFQKNYDRIYRVTYNPKFIDLPAPFAVLPPVAATMFKSNFPEMEEVARMYKRNASISVENTSQGKKQFEEGKFFFADPSILKIFTFDFIEGNPITALNNQFDVILTDATALKYFGKESALGKTILFGGKYPMKVSGVVKEFPDNSHIKFNFISNYETMYATENEIARNNLAQNWVISHSYTYVLLKPNQNPDKIEAQFPPFLLKNANEGFGKDIEYKMQPMKDFHLYSNVSEEPEPAGSIKLLYVLASIAFITLLIACINFVNLSTARSLKRSKEVGMRKMLGAAKSQLVTQFLSESMLTSAVAFIFSLLCMYLLMPLMNQLTGAYLSMDQLFGDPVLLFCFVLILLLTAIIAGSYPAFFVTKFAPLETVRGGFNSTKSVGGKIRKLLVVVQFTASITLIIGALIAYQQLNFMQQQPLGFDKDYIITAQLSSQNLNNIFIQPDSTYYDRLQTFSNILKQNPDIKSVTLSDDKLGVGATMRGVTPEGFKETDNKFISCLSVDFGFLQTFQLQIVAGRDFSKDFISDNKSAFIINEKGAKSFGWNTPQEALGKNIDREGKIGKIIGVVKDFHLTPLQLPIEGVLFDITKNHLNVFSIKVNSKNIPKTLAYIEGKWSQFFPEKVFQYNFLNETIAAQYEAEQRLSKIIICFATLAIFISCLGLYGLIMLVTQQRIKEIGIRKVLGASVSSITNLLSKDFIILILISFVLACPIAYYGMNKWLQEFSYRINLSWWIFAAAGFFAILIGWITTSAHTVKAALANPVKSLRTE